MIGKGSNPKKVRPSPQSYYIIRHCLAACRADDTHSPARAAYLPLPVSTSKSIRGMRSVQDSVLPEGCGGEASPHCSSLLFSPSRSHITDAPASNQGQKTKKGKAIAFPFSIGVDVLRPSYGEVPSRPRQAPRGRARSVRERLEHFLPCRS